jgi:hypothetical protein
MKTLKENTTEFISDVKQVLDGASWDWEACTSSLRHEDADKACHYLESQKFSFETVKEALADVWDDFLYNVKSQKIRNNEMALYAARMIANELAYKRINKFSVDQSRPRNYYDSKKWWINETITFKIYPGLH